MAESAANGARWLRTVYKYGSLRDGNIGYMTLRPDGRIGYYRHPNETTYRIEDGTLNFANSAGQITSSLVCHPDANCFLPRPTSGVFLVPALELDAHATPIAGRHRIIFNTVPKSGTYFVEAAARELGLRTLKLHLLANRCNDYRGLADSERLARQIEHRLQVPAGAIASIMADGEVAVGHIADKRQLDEINKAGVTLIHCVRDLRTVLVSQYRFRRRQVQPISAADKVWRAVPDPDQFLAFLAHATSDITLIRTTAEMILKRKEPRLSYESLAGSDGMASARRELQKLSGSFAEEFLAAVSKVRGKPTSTSSDSLSDYRQYWNDAVQDFFQASGLARLNRQLGYSN